MKSCISICLSLFMIPVLAQVSEHTDLIRPGEYDNIKIHKLSSDKHSSGFIIWVKDYVRLHKHERHSETIYVLEGEGDMKLGDDTIHVKPGTYVFVPEGTPHSLKVTSDAPVRVLSVQSPEFSGEDRVFLE